MAGEQLKEGHDALAPGERALSAMAAAAHRARVLDPTAGASWAQRADTGQVDPVVAPANPPRLTVFRRRGDVLLLRRAIFIVVAAIVVLLAVLIGVHLSNTSGASGTTSGRNSQSGQPANPSPSSHSSAPTNSTPSTTAPSSAGGAPQISSLDPAQGAAGQTVVISGSNFMSANGQILAYFGSEVAPTSCPVMSSCTVTVPPMQGTTTTIPVTVQTQSGTSNALMFTYQ